MAPEQRFCKRCGRQLVGRPKAVGRRYFEAESGVEMRKFAGTHILASRIEWMGEIRCPSFWCNLGHDAVVAERMVLDGGQVLSRDPSEHLW